MNSNDSPSERIRRIETSVLPFEELPNRREARISIKTLMAHMLVPACSLAIIDDGQTIATRGYGVTRANGSTAVTPSTIFQACSISKAVASVGALRLVQEGRLALDEDINNYLRSWQLPANGDWQPRVTLRHLLTHTAGLNYCWFPGYRRGGPMPTTLQTVSGASPANTPPVQATGLPGAEFSYSGAHYAVLQLVIEERAGEPFQDLMQRVVFEPLGMRDSSYGQSFPDSRPGGVALGHNAGGVPLAGGWHLQPEQAGAGLWTTPADLCRLAMEIQAAQTGKSASILNQEIVMDMLSPGPGNRGLGWQMKVGEDWLWFEHGGDNVGYKCALLADTAQDRGVAVMTNGDAGGLVCSRVLSAVAAEYGWLKDVVDDTTLGFRAPPTVDTQIDPELLAGCAGAYELETGLRLKINNTAGQLSLNAEGQPPLALLPISASKFVAESVNVTIRFDLAHGDSVPTLRFQQFGDEIMGSRIN